MARLGQPLAPPVSVLIYDWRISLLKKSFVYSLLKKVVQNECVLVELCYFRIKTSSTSQGIILWIIDTSLHWSFSLLNYWSGLLKNYQHFSESGINFVICLQKYQFQMLSPTPGNASVALFISAHWNDHAKASHIFTLSCCMHLPFPIIHVTC
jgi:hypothetical protein